MGITIDQTSGLAQIGSGSSAVCTWAANPTAGAKVLVYVQLGATPTSVVDNGTTPSTFVLDALSSIAAKCYVYRADNITLPASGQYHVTVNYTPGSATIQARGRSYLGVAAGPPTVTNSASGTSGSPVTGTVTSAAGGALFVGLFTDTTSINPESINLTSAGWNTVALLTNGSAMWAGGFADFIGAPGGPNSSQATWTLGDAPTWGGLIAVYEAAGGGGGGGGGGSSVVPTWSNPTDVYNQVLNDDFTAFNTTIWGAGWQTPTGLTPPVDTSNETAGYNSTHVTVSGGTLNLLLDSTSVTVNSVTYPHTGAAVTSDTDPSTGGTTGFTFEHGAIEARVFIPPPTSGSAVPNWPSFWLVNPATQQSATSYFEIDLMEGLGGGTAVHVHWSVAGSAANSGSIGSWLPAQTGWHNIGCNWTPQQVEFYYDALLICVLPTPPGLGTVDLFINFINTISAAYPSGPGGANQVPATEKVDWVRVWSAGPALSIPPMESLHDDFSSNTLLTKWGTSSVNTDFGTVSISGSQANLPCDAVAGEALSSSTVYSLYSSSMYAKVIVSSGTLSKTGFQATNLSGSPWPALNGQPAQIGGVSVTWEYSQSNGHLTAILSQGATDTTVGFITYSAVTHAWLRIREAGGLLYWETSANGLSWTTQFTHSYTADLGRLFATMYTIADPGDETQVAHVQNFNTGGTSGQVPGKARALNQGVNRSAVW
jgi:hypothetical protein